MLFNIIKVTESRILRWAERLADTRKLKNALEFLNVNTDLCEDVVHFLVSE
jgi:hypothetical protein